MIKFDFKELYDVLKEGYEKLDTKHEPVSVHLASNIIQAFQQAYMFYTDFGKVKIFSDNSLKDNKVIVTYRREKDIYEIISEYIGEKDAWFVKLHLDETKMLELLESMFPDKQIDKYKYEYVLVKDLLSNKEGHIAPTPMINFKGSHIRKNGSPLVNQFLIETPINQDDKFTLFTEFSILGGLPDYMNTKNMKVM